MPLRIALIADIHGNTVALEAVLAGLERHPTDHIVCLGDIAAGGPDPAGAIDRLRELGCLTVRGNTDVGMVDMPDWWLEPSSIGLPEAAIPGMEISVWAAEQLSEAHRRHLAGLPGTRALDLGLAGRMLAFHGSPRSADELITATTPDDALEEMVEGIPATVLAGGHTHVPLVRRAGHRTLVNPGSVGMPFETYGYAGGVPVLWHAAYAVVTVDGPEVSFSLRQVAVDRDAVEDSVRESGMPHAEWWLGLRRA